MPGEDADGAGPATEFGVDAFSTIQEGLDFVGSGGIVHVNPGTYPAYAGMYQKANMGDTTYHRGALTTDRTELVRVELDQNGVEINPSLEVVAEYAVDLKFGLVRDTGVNVATTVPQLQREAIDADNVYAVTAPPSAGGATAPETVRALRVRLAPRAARPDGDTDLNLPNGTALRYDLGPGRGFVRLRTLVTDVALMNQQRTPGQP